MPYHLMLLKDGSTVLVPISYTFCIFSMLVADALFVWNCWKKMQTCLFPILTYFVYSTYKNIHRICCKRDKLKLKSNPINSTIKDLQYTYGIQSLDMHKDRVEVLFVPPKT